MNLFKRKSLSWLIIFYFFLNSFNMYSIGENNTNLISDIYHTPNNPNENEIVKVYANINTELVKETILVFRVDNNTWINKTLKIDYSTYFSCEIGPFNDGSQVYYYFYLNLKNNSIYIEDNSGYYFNFFVFHLNDNTPPVFYDNFYNYSIDDNKLNLGVYCNVSDVHGIKEVNLIYRINYEEWNKKTMNLNLENWYTISLSFNIFDLNILHFYVEAIDNSINHNKSFSNNGSFYEISLQSEDKEPPILKKITVSPKKPTKNDNITISIIVSDESDIKIVKFFFFYQERWSVKYMSNDINNEDLYEVTIGPFSEGNVINFYIVIIDNSIYSNSLIANNNGHYYQIRIQQETSKVNSFFSFNIAFALLFIISFKKRKKIKDLKFKL